MILFIIRTLRRFRKCISLCNAFLRYTNLAVNIREWVYLFSSSFLDRFNFSGPVVDLSSFHFKPFMKTILSLAACTLLSCQTAFSNGGGYVRGGVASTGNISLFEPSETEKVAIMDEQLTISPRGGSTHVSVRYLMQNTTGSKAKVQFGFPVEEQFHLSTMEVPPQVHPMPDKLSYCKDYRVLINGKEIATKFKAEPHTENGGLSGILGWLVSDVVYAADEVKQVEITYRSESPRDESFISDNSSHGDVLFKYRLSSGACWQGPIRKGRVVIEPWTFMDPRELKIQKPVNRFEQRGKQWVWEFENLEPTLADDIVVQIEPKTDSYPVVSAQEATKFDGEVYLGENSLRGGRWEVEHTNYKVQASSTLADEQDAQKFLPSKVRGYTGCWSEGAKGQGVGEWLELMPEVPSVLRAISIWPGFRNTDKESAGLFQANARPKKVRIELNGEKSYDVELEDRPEYQRLFLPDYAKPVKTLRLTFLSVYPGDQFEDLCVAGVRLISGLSKEPKIAPCR
jgi:hypothetical protein